MQRFVVYCLATGILLPMAPSAMASDAGRRNTALATTALAVGAWSSGTGHAGRRNTAILATAGAGLAWSRYSAKKRDERRRRARRRAAVMAFRENRGDGYWGPGRGCKVGHFIG
ncbi:MAG: hypothetical protein HY248_04255, partial [Fimbriimonas ginsengisoli]|nr:hypothetical protein [Fimbriimonas ginsengisoli]